jgi:tRNA (mo5U34)-methyltransferase
MPFPDKGVEKLNKLLPLDGMSVLEMGCFEGHHTVSLVMHAADVWAIDGRIENVIKTLVRVWGAGYEKRATVNCIDLEKGSLQEQIRALGRDDGFDLIHHRGVLYHLSDPVNHINECSMVCKKHLYLHTQIATDEMAKDESTLNKKSYQVYRYKEPESAFSPFAGITQNALWLTKSSLLDLLKDVGFNKVSVISEVQERNGPRIELLCSR